MAATFKFYLDASALVRLVVEEPGAKALREFFNSNTGACATVISFVEALGVLKRKWRQNNLDHQAYHAAVEELQIHVYGEKLELDDVTLANPVRFKESAVLASTHKLDFADAIQLYAIKNGKYAIFVGDSRTRFMSADRGLAKAARALSIRTWNCGNDSPARWA